MTLMNIQTVNIRVVPRCWNSLGKEVSKLPFKWGIPNHFEGSSFEVSSNKVMLEVDVLRRRIIPVLVQLPFGVTVMISVLAQGGVGGRLLSAVMFSPLIIPPVQTKPLPCTLSFVSFHFHRFKPYNWNAIQICSLTRFVLTPLEIQQRQGPK
jgi:hypothetical protein